MHATLLILQKSPDVFDLFTKDKHAPACSALFASDLYYYAVIMADEVEVISSLKREFAFFTVSQNIILAHGDIAEMVDDYEYQYALKVFPILKMDETKDFYQHITNDIAQSFLNYNQMCMDFDFINEDYNQLFVFTKFEKNKTANQTFINPKELFPEFYHRLDKLIKEDIGKSTSLELVYIQDLKLSVQEDKSEAIRRRF